MQPSHKASSQLLFSDQLEICPISPGRRKSKNLSISPLSPEFFVDISEKSETNLLLKVSSDNIAEASKERVQTLFKTVGNPSQAQIFHRDRSNDIYNVESPLSSFRKSFSSDSENSESSSMEKTLKEMLGSNDDLKLPFISLNEPNELTSQSIHNLSINNFESSDRSKSPLRHEEDQIILSSDRKEVHFSPSAKTEVLPTKNKTSPGQAKPSESRSSIKKIKSVIFQVPEKPCQEKSMTHKNELEVCTPTIILPSNNKILHINALKIIGLPNRLPDDNRLVSFELGKVILQPKKEMKSLVESILLNGFNHPKVSAEEMWRSMEATKLYDCQSEKPIIDGATMNQDDKDSESSIHMGKMLNFLFQHLSRSDDELIPVKDFGCSQIDAGNIGINFVKRLELKENAGMDESITKSMRLVLSLGKQELYTHPATWAIPSEYHTVGGKDDLVVTEFGPTVGEKVKPLQYDREISIKMRDDGGLDYVVDQPITFKDRKSNDLLGTCRIQTTLSFDKMMNCISQKQEIKAASILKGEF